MTALITAMLEEGGNPAPVLIGGLALSYYTREVYFTSDIDLAYSDREALDNDLQYFFIPGKCQTHDIM